MASETVVSPGYSCSQCRALLRADADSWQGWAALSAVRPRWNSSRAGARGEARPAACFPAGEPGAEAGLGTDTGHQRIPEPPRGFGPSGPYASRGARLDASAVDRDHWSARLGILAPECLP